MNSALGKDSPFISKANIFQKKHWL